MENKDGKQIWNDYIKDELLLLTPILKELDFELDEFQPHTIGERFLMQAMTTASGTKLILLGNRKSDGLRVIIKATRDRSGSKELEHERKSREIIQKIKFAYQVFFSPREILFIKKNGYTISISEFIEQECPFLERPIEEQFSFALKSFKAQESAHATTYEHKKMIRKVFECFDSQHYIKNFDNFKKTILDEKISKSLRDASILLKENEENLDQYSSFLTHTDFVPHNFRISGNDIYLLDHSSIRFGNKYEGWARFINFMALYNPKLEKILLDYVRNNRTEEEYLSLKLMRLYRLGEIISYYSLRLDQSTGDLNTLDKERIQFWGNVLMAVLEDKPLSSETLESYKQKRDSLRSHEEKQRQLGLH